MPVTMATTSHLDCIYGHCLQNIGKGVIFDTIEMGEGLVSNQTKWNHQFYVYAYHIEGGPRSTFY